MLKPFDKVNHKLFLHKLQLCGIRGLTPYWLTDCIKRVTAHVFTSANLALRSGVPQGSILGPVLINMLMIFPMELHPVTFLCSQTYSTLFKEIQIIKDCRQLQNDLDQVQIWFENSSLKFNSSKCKSQTITWKLKPTIQEYQLNNIVSKWWTSKWAVFESQ